MIAEAVDAEFAAPKAAGSAELQSSAPESSTEASKDTTSRPSKSAYPPAAAAPTQEGPLGVRFDFNLGARVLLPARTDEGEWLIRLRDLDTGNILFESRNKMRRPKLIEAGG